MYVSTFARFPLEAAEENSNLFLDIKIQRDFRIPKPTVFIEIVSEHQPKTQVALSLEYTLWLLSQPLRKTPGSSLTFNNLKLSYVIECGDTPTARISLGNSTISLNSYQWKTLKSINPLIKYIASTTEMIRKAKSDYEEQIVAKRLMYTLIKVGMQNLEDKEDDEQREMEMNEPQELYEDSWTTEDEIWNWTEINSFQTQREKTLKKIFANLAELIGVGPEHMFQVESEYKWMIKDIKRGKQEFIHNRDMEGIKLILTRSLLE